MFQEFLHVTLDLNIAHRWLSLSASQGHAEGEARYGVLWEMGWGCEKDPQKAFSLYEKAANKEDPLGQFLLARALGKGQGCEKDPIASANWLLKAAEGGHAASKFLSCLLLLSGSGIPADKQKALDLLCQAADKGCAPAMKMAGVMMKKGICFSKNKPFGRSLIYMAEDMATLPLPAYGQSAIEEESQSPPSWLGKEALEKYSLNPQDLRRIWEGAILEGMAFTDIFFCLC
jgi:TPR repeat protein